MWKSSGQESTDDAIDAERERVKADGVSLKKKVEQKTLREERNFHDAKRNPKKMWKLAPVPHTHTTHR